MTQLRQLTGCSQPTLKKRLGGLEPSARDGRTIWYEAREALPRIFGVGGLDLTSERARLASEQADAQELKNALSRGELVPPDTMDQAMVALSTAISARLQSMGTRTAQALAAETSAAGCQGIVDEAVGQTLHELVEEAEKAAARLARPTAGRSSAASQ